MSGHALGDLVEGATLPVFTRTTGLQNWNRYAAVNDEFVAMHMDDEAGQAAGYSGAFGMGNLQIAYLHNMLRDWLGDRGRILSVSCQFRSPNLKGMVLNAGGRIASVSRDERGTVVELEVWVESDSSDALAPGHATVVVTER